MQLAVLPKIASPVAQVQHVGLLDPQAHPAPQRGGQVVARGGQELPRGGQVLSPRAEQHLDLLGRGRHSGRAVVGLGGAVVLVDHLGDHTPGQRVDVALVAGDQELEEARQRPRLALHRQPRTLQLLALQGQEPVGVMRLRGPDRAAQEADELKQHRSVGGDGAIAQPGPQRRQQVLVDQLLLEVLGLLGSLQPPRRSQRAHHRKPHAPHARPWSRSGISAAWIESRGSFRIPERLSTIPLDQGHPAWPHLHESQQTADENQPKEVPASDPAELANQPPPSPPLAVEA
jgi:hypothetical protein